MKKILLILMILLLFGCSETKKIVDPGYFEGQTYKNDYLNLKIDFPESYTLIDYDMVKEMRKKENEFTSEVKESYSEKQFEHLYDDVLFSIGAYQYPLDDLDQYNNNITVAAERAVGKDAGEVADMLKETYAQFDAARVLSHEKYVKLNNRSYEKLVIAYNIAGLELIQVQYVTVNNRYGIIFGHTYEKGHEVDVTSTLESITFGDFE